MGTRMSLHKKSSGSVGIDELLNRIGYLEREISDARKFTDDTNHYATLDQRMDHIEAMLAYVQETGGGSVGDGTMNVMEKAYRVTVQGSETIRVAVPVGFKKYDLRALRAKSISGSQVVLSVYDSAGADGVEEYRTKQASSIYDLIQLPIVNKDNASSVHLKVVNCGLSQTDVEIVLKVIELK